jgi:dihydropteroate synthase
MDISRVEVTHFPKNRYLRIGDKLLDLTLPKIMGILNATPDSFYSHSRKENEKDLVSSVRRMLEEGADMIDLGGYSTRPGAENVSEEEELKRIVPYVERFKKEFPETILSVDTFRPSVAQAAIDKGADIINDISGWQFEPEMLEVVAKNKVPYILMHLEGNLESMHVTKDHENFFRDIVYYFSRKIQILNERGISDIIIDPGFGFGKTVEQNYEILRNLEMFHLMERPILVGISRKSMICKKLYITPENALNATTVLNTQAVMKGASILRVHDVKEANELLRLLF